MRVEGSAGVRREAAARALHLMRRSEARRKDRAGASLRTRRFQASAWTKLFRFACGLKPAQDLRVQGSQATNAGCAVNCKQDDAALQEVFVNTDARRL
eukprot:3581814-Pleurochrysis_carterae.AAC.4